MDGLLKKKSSSTSSLPNLLGRTDNMKTEYTSTYEGITLTVSNLNKEITLDVLKREFSRFGNVINAKITEEYPDSPVNTGYISYYSPAEAHRAVEGLNGVTVLNCTLYVGLPKQRQRKRSKTLYRGIPQMQSMTFCTDVQRRTRSDSSNNNTSRHQMSTSWEVCSLHRRKTSGESLIEFKRSVLSRTASLNT